MTTQQGVSELTRELLPCPFCGAVASFGAVGDEDNANFDGRYIACTNPRCLVTTQLRFACGDDPNPLLAEVWNRRTTAPAVAEPFAMFQRATGHLRFKDTITMAAAQRGHEAEIPLYTRSTHTAQAVAWQPIATLQPNVCVALLCADRWMGDDIIGQRKDIGYLTDGGWFSTVGETRAMTRETYSHWSALPTAPSDEEAT